MFAARMKTKSLLDGGKNMGAITLLLPAVIDEGTRLNASSSNLAFLWLHFYGWDAQLPV
jgi:hypothetical protein